MPGWYQGRHAGRELSHQARPWPGAGRLAGYGEHDLSARVLALEDPVSLRDFGQRQQVADDRPQGASGQQRGQCPGALAIVLDEYAVEGDVGVQQRVEVEFRG